MIASSSSSISSDSSPRIVHAGDNADEEDEDSIPLAKLLVKKRKKTPKEEDEIRHVTSKWSHVDSTRNANGGLSCQDDSRKATIVQEEVVGRRRRNRGIVTAHANILHYLSCRSADSTTRQKFLVNTHRIRSWFLLRRSAYTCTQMNTSDSTATAGTTSVTCLSFHTDGAYVAVGYLDGTLRIYSCPATALSSLSLLYQRQWETKPVTNIQWSPDHNNAHEIAVAFLTTTSSRNRAEALRIIHLDFYTTTRTPIGTTSTTASTSTTSIINSLLFLPSISSSSTPTTTTQLVAGTSTGSICVWAYRYRMTTNSQQQQQQQTAAPTSSPLSCHWKLIYNTFTILPRGESITDMKHVTEGIIAVAGKLGSIALVDLWKSHTPIFSSRQRVPTILHQIRIPHHNTPQQQPLQRLYTHLTTAYTNAVGSSRNSVSSYLLEHITIWTLSYHGTVTRIVFQRKRRNSASSSHNKSSKLGITTAGKIPASIHYEPSFTTLYTNAVPSTKHCTVNHCIGDILLLHNPFMLLVFLGQQEKEEEDTTSSTTHTQKSNRWDPRILALPSQEHKTASRYSITITFLDPHQQVARYGVLCLPQEPRHILVHPTNHSYVMVAYSNGSVELISIKPSP